MYYSKYRLMHEINVCEVCAVETGHPDCAVRARRGPRCALVHIMVHRTCGHTKSVGRAGQRQVAFHFPVSIYDGL